VVLNQRFFLSMYFLGFNKQGASISVFLLAQLYFTLMFQQVCRIFLAYLLVNPSSVVIFPQARRAFWAYLLVKPLPMAMFQQARYFFFYMSAGQVSINT